MGTTTDLEIPNLKEQITPYETIFIRSIESLRAILISRFEEYGFTVSQVDEIKKFWEDKVEYYGFRIIPEVKQTPRMMKVTVSMEGKLYFELFQDNSNVMGATVKWGKVHASRLTEHPLILSLTETWTDIPALVGIIENIANFFLEVRI